MFVFIFLNVFIIVIFSYIYISQEGAETNLRCHGIYTVS